MFVFQGLPSLDVDNGIFRSWWFEPLVATMSFAVFINWYWYHERLRGLSKAFQDSFKVNDFPITSSFAAYWIGIYLWKSVVPPAAPEIPDGIPTNMWQLLCLLAELVAGIVLYDAIFFWIHWAMHELPMLQKYHRRHHQHIPVESFDVLRHSLVDGSLQVLVNILVQRNNLIWGPVKSRLARCLHNVVVVWLLTESHTASPHPNIWRRWFVGVREHRNHHYVGGGDGQHHHHHHRYQQFFGYLDDLRMSFGSSSSSSSWSDVLGGYSWKMLVRGWLVRANNATSTKKSL